MTVYVVNRFIKILKLFTMEVWACCEIEKLFHVHHYIFLSIFLKASING